MRIGTIGAGEVALAVAREALARGHEVVLSSRSGRGALADKVTDLGKGASAATVEEAGSLDYVLLAVPWRNVDVALRGLPEWKGRVLIAGRGNLLKIPNRAELRGGSKMTALSRRSLLRSSEPWRGRISPTRRPRSSILSLSAAR
jgi:predicted dinucleotide-binding enzyme